MDGILEADWRITSGHTSANQKPVFSCGERSRNVDPILQTAKIPHNFQQSLRFEWRSKYKFIQGFLHTSN